MPILSTKVERNLRQRMFYAAGLLTILAALASLSDALVLGGLRLFLGFAGAAQGGLALGPWSWNGQLRLPLWALGMVAIIVVRLLLQWLRLVRTESLARGIERYLRMWMRVGVRRLPPKFFHHPLSTERLQSAEEGARIVVQSVEAQGQFLQAAAQLIVFLPLLCWISWSLTVGILLGMLPLLAWMQGVLRRLSKHVDKRLDAQGHFRERNDRWVTLVRNWSLRNDLSQMEQGLRADADVLWRDGMKLGKRRGVFSLGADAVAALAVIGVLSVCGWWLSKGLMHSADLVLYAAALLLCYKPVKDCLRFVPLWKESQGARRYLGVLEGQMNHRRKSREVSVYTQTTIPVLSWQNLDFSYHGELVHQVFHQHSGRIAMDRQGWLCGANGCGKTTLLRLLAGLEDPDAGSILWPQKLQHASVVFLSHKSILPDVSLLRSRAQQPMIPELQALWRVLGIYDFWDREGLSAGQWQRLGLAWAFSSSAAVILLDEPFAFIAEPARAPILQALLTCSQAQGSYFLWASNDPFPEMFRDSFHRMELNADPT